MTGSNVDHMDVGAYALGVLSDWEATQFEMHLAECATCAHELEDLTLVAGLLSHVDGSSIEVVEEYGRDGRALDRMLNVVSMERRRSRARRVLSAAAAIVLVVAGVAFGAFGLTQEPGGVSAPPGTYVPSQDPNALKANAVDPESGVDASVALSDRGWGAEVQLKLTKLDGPITCKLVAISKAGVADVAMTWSVPAEGYGVSNAQLDPLIISGATSLKRGDIDRFEVRTVPDSPQKQALVTIPVP